MTGIFISYRRGDTPGMAGRLFDRLAQSYPTSDLFMDVDGMQAGIDFVQQLELQLGKCKLLLAVIGPGWLDAKDPEGRRRIDREDDFVRLEIASALKRNVRVIPVLLDSTVMPTEAELPPDLRPLARRHSVELRHTRFNADADAIVSAVDKAMPGRRIRSWRLLVPLGLAAAGITGVYLMFGLPSSQNKSPQLDPPSKSGSDETARKSDQRGPEGSEELNEGTKYQYGQGVPKDLAKARTLYELAAAKGNTPALNNLGWLYHNGLGVPVDYQKARDYYEKAAAAGGPKAMNNLGGLYQDGLGVPQDFQKAREWFQRSADKSHPSAARNLARLLDSGKGGATDPQKAARLLFAAAIAGNDNARRELIGNMPGWSVETRIAAQQVLAEAGLFKGTADGLWLANSQDAAQAYLDRRKNKQ